MPFTIAPLNLLRAFAIVGFCAVLVVPTAAQTNTGEIEGVVKDVSGGGLPGATVTVVQLSTGETVEGRTDDRGLFFIPGLPVGEYTVSVRLEGFKVVTRSGIFLRVGQRLEVPVVLPIGSQSESVTVTAAVPILQATNAEVSDIIDNIRVAQLPLNGRQFLQLAQLSDGVVLPPGGTRGPRSSRLARCLRYSGNGR